MKNKLIIPALLILISVTALVSFKSSTKDVKFMQLTTIESVVPGGLGRSRMITMDANGQMSEIKMENFFSLAGINFGNVRANDQQITDKIERMVNDGWELTQVTPGVYSEDKGTGLFITRYLFKK